MKKIYISPKSHNVELELEQMIAGSMKISNNSVDTQMSNKKDKDMWGNAGIWK